MAATLAPAAQLPAAGSTGDEPVTFTVGLLNEVDSFNPFKGIEAPSFEAWALTYDFLVSYSMEDMSPAPGLAESWETSEDGRTWTFHLRDDVTWSDGETLDSADVVHTYSRVVDGGVEADTWGSYLNAVEEVTAPDPRTVELRLSRPNAVLPLLPIPILPEHVWGDISEEKADTYAAEPVDGQPVVGSGPFQLVEGTAGGSTYRFQANPDYWGGAPHVDEVVFRVFKAEDPAVQALIKGEIDFLHDITAVQIQALEGRDGITAIQGNSPLFDEFAFNSGAVDLETGEPIGDGNPALLDPAFRHALGYAIDVDRLIESAYQGAAEPGQVIVPAAYPDYHWKPPADEAFTFDLDRAGELLDEAGYTIGDDGWRTMPDGSPIRPLRLVGRPEEPRSLKTLDFFKEWLSDLGIRSEVSAMESARLTTAILDGEFDVFHWNWYVEPDPDAVLDVMTCAERGNWSDSWYCNEEYDRLYDAQNREMDPDARVEMIHEMQRILWEESPYLVIGYAKTGQAFRSDRFACFQPQPDPGGVLLVQYGARNYTLLRPADEAGDCDGVTSALGASAGARDAADGEDESGTSTGVLLAGGAALLVALGGGGLWVARRRSTAAERE
jgi:peptide/nickel transport system substrate-binding protein